MLGLLVMLVGVANATSAYAVAVGQGSAAPARYVESYQRNGGQPNGGLPVNVVHGWGAGSVQDYRGGTFGWGAILLKGDSAANSAFMVHGGIWDKYAALGGPGTALGFPVSDEGEAAKSAVTGVTGRYSRFEGGSIQWHRDGPRANQVFEVHGSIFNKWGSMGYGNSVLGFPASDEMEAYPSAVTNATARVSRFEGGSVTWHRNGARANQSFEVHGGIFNKWAGMNYGKSVLGLPISDEGEAAKSAVTAVTGRYGRFEGGSIQWHRNGPLANQSYEVHGAIFNKWGSMGYGNSVLGFPIADEGEAAKSAVTAVTGRYSRFEGGSVTWHRNGARANHAFEVHGGIFDRWSEMGYGVSRLGLPVEDEFAWEGRRRSNFEGGYVTWRPNEGTVVTLRDAPANESVLVALERTSERLSGRFPASQLQLRSLLLPMQGRRLSSDEQRRLQKLLLIEQEAEQFERHMTRVEDAINEGGGRVWSDVVSALTASVPNAVKEVALSFVKEQVLSLKRFAMAAVADSAKELVTNAIGRVGDQLAGGRVPPMGTEFRTAGDTILDWELARAVSLASSANGGESIGCLKSAIAQQSAVADAVVGMQVNLFYESNELSQMPFAGAVFLPGKWLAMLKMSNLLWSDREGFPGMLRATVTIAFGAANSSSVASSPSGLASSSGGQPLGVRSDFVVARLKGPSVLAIRNSAGQVAGCPSSEATAVCEIPGALVGAEALSMKFVAVPASSAPVRIEVLSAGGSPPSQLSVARLTDVNRCQPLLVWNGSGSYAATISVAPLSISVKVVRSAPRGRTREVSLSGGTVPLVAGALVQLRAGPSRRGRWRAVASTRTDQYGRYRFRRLVRQRVYMRVSVRPAEGTAEAVSKLAVAAR